MGDKLNPLPVGNSGDKPASAAPLEAAPASHAVEPVTDSVDKWIQDNPTFDDANPAPEPKAADENAPAVGDAPVAVEPGKKPDEAVAPAGVAQKPAEVAPAAAAPPKPSYATDEKIGLAEGAEWTRGQIVAALKERAELQQSAPKLHAEAENYKKLFGVQSFEQAQQSWGPLLQRLSKEPNTLGFIDAYLNDPAKAEYLEQCAQFFEQQVPAGERPRVNDPAARVPQQNESERVMAQQLRELHDWKQTQEKRDADARIQGELAQAATRYPFLAHDEAARRDLLATAQGMWLQDNTKGILDALALKAPLYDKLGVLTSASSSSAPAAAPVPALLGSPGASPDASRSTQDNRRNRSDDPVERWMTSPPKQFAS